MRRLVLIATLLAVSAASAPAMAQFYYPGPYAPPPPPAYDPYYRPRGYYPPPPAYGYRQRVRFGEYCETGRGGCYIGRPVPVGSRCRCDIPGFGLKRGVVQ